MTDSSHVSLNGFPVDFARIVIPRIGVWFADLNLGPEADLEGLAILKVGPVEFHGIASKVNTFGEKKRVRLVAGLGGWGKLVSPKAYHNDAGVKALSVVQDIASSVGETIGEFNPEKERLRSHYVREAGPASRVLEESIGNAEWFVDYDGITQIGKDRSNAPDVDAFDILDFDLADQTLNIATDQVDIVRIGSVVSGGLLESEKKVYGLIIEISSESIRISARVGDVDTPPNNLASTLKSIIQRNTDDRLYGIYKYRVFRMSGEKVDLQSVRQSDGLPDILPVSQWPGLPGLDATLAEGSEVLVQFISGDRTQPVITQYVGKNGPGFVPDRLNIASESNAPNAARAGDTVHVLLPPMVFVGQVGGQPATGVVTATLPQTQGLIQDGSSKVGIG